MQNVERTDRYLRWAVAIVAVAVLAVGSLFAWTVYRDRQAADEANPAMRVVRALTQQVRQAPNDVILRVRLGEALAAAGKPDQAVEQLNAALKIDPEHTGALLDLGQIAVMEERLPEAQRYFKRVVDITGGSDYETTDSRREVALYQLGRLAFNEKEYEAAAGYFKEALRIRKDASDTYFMLAQALDALGDAQGAKRQLEIALAFDPNFPQGRYFLGELLLREGDRAAAAEQFARALRFDREAPEPAKALEQFGDAAELAKKAEASLQAEPVKALEHIRIARALAPESVDYMKLHARVLLELGRKRDAYEVYKLAQTAAPDDAEIKKAVESLRAELLKKP